MAKKLVRTAVWAAVLVILAGCGGPEIAGMWTGRGAGGVPVTYVFADDGSGYRDVGGRHEALFYRFQAGYPNRIEIRPEGSPTSRGLMEMTASDMLRLEVGPPGGPPPEQISPHALRLRRAPTR